MMTRAAIDGRFDLDRDTYARIVAHARSDYPYEVCGLLAGADGVVRRQFEIPNAARSMTYYSMEPRAMLHAFNEMDEHGWDLLAIYHSHTHTEAFPSPTDVELAFYPDATYLIVSLQDSTPVVRAFAIRDGRITERELYMDGGRALAATG
jgi:[CysO sulfur-carrier protein]-S-L-cysteine hydrolase